MAEPDSWQNTPLPQRATPSSQNAPSALVSTLPHRQIPTHLGNYSDMRDSWASLCLSGFRNTVTYFFFTKLLRANCFNKDSNLEINVHCFNFVLFHAFHCCWPTWKIEKSRKSAKCCTCTGLTTILPQLGWHGSWVSLQHGCGPQNQRWTVLGWKRHSEGVGAREA